MSAVFGLLRPKWQRLMSVGLRSKEPRDQSREIGWISTTGNGSGRIGVAIKWLLKAEVAAVIVVADDGSVYAVSVGGDYERRVTATRPGWILGTYNRDVDHQVIVQDLRERAQELARERKELTA